MALISGSQTLSTTDLTALVAGGANIDWETSTRTASFTAVAGKGYVVDCSGGARTVTLPAGSAGDIIAIVDYSGNAATNNIILAANGSEKVQGITSNKSVSTNRQAVQLLYFDSTQGWIVPWSTADLVTVIGTATGGDISTYSGYKVHIFDNVSATEDFVISTLAITCDILIIAGGGAAAGTYHGGAGGAGGFVYYSQKSLAIGTYTINCGDKGSGEDGDYNNRNHTNGEDTTMTGQTTAVGGGRGGWEGSTHGAVGGSGGGSGSILTGGTPPYRTGGLGTANQGNKGGNVPASSTTWQGTGGGGGAGGEGAEGTNDNSTGGGDGGDGGAGYTEGATVYNFNGGSTVTFPALFKLGTGSNLEYCGGGGGGGNNSGGSASHGGGAGSTSAGADATKYGSGGGASARSGGFHDGGDGYQGVVIIRYAV